MLRTALKPRWLALLAVVLVLATVMARLGQWQWDRAREQGRKDALATATARPAVPLLDLLRPQQTFTNAVADRPVTVTGRWDGAHQVLVADRYLNADRGWWVLTPLILPDDAAQPGLGASGLGASGLGGPGAIAVVRGWVGSPSDAAASPAALTAGQVRLTGVLRPGEPPIDRDPGAGSGLPSGQLDGVDLTQLVQRWPYRLITGYLVLTGQTSAVGGDGAGVAGVVGAVGGLRAVPPTSPGSKALAWQNLSYAVQWFAFAGFGLFMWWRLVRDDHRGRLRPARPAARDTPDGAALDADSAPDHDSAPVPDRGAL